MIEHKSQRHREQDLDWQDSEARRLERQRQHRNEVIRSSLSLDDKISMRGHAPIGSNPERSQELRPGHERGWLATEIRRLIHRERRYRAGLWNIH